MAPRSFPLSVIITGIDRFTKPLASFRARVNEATADQRAQQRLLSNSYASFKNELRGISEVSGLTSIWNRTKDLSTALGKVGTAARTSFGRGSALALVGAGAAFGFKRQFVDTADDFQRLGISLEAIEGSAEKAGRSMGFIKQLGAKTPFEIMEVADAFRQMRNVGMDAISGDAGLQAISDQVAKFGGNGEALNGVTLALTQMYSSNRVGAQDMLQLTNRQIPAWQLLQRAVQRTTGRLIEIGQLRKMAEKNAFQKNTVLEIIRQMGIESKGAADRMNKTFGGLFSNLADQWTFFKLRVLKIDDAGRAIAGGLMDRMQQRLQGVLNLVDTMASDGRLQRWADRIGNSFMDGFGWLEKNGPMILSDVGAGLQHAFNVADGISKVFGGWGNMLAAAGGAYIFLPLVQSIASVTSAVVALNSVLAFTPAGWLLAGGAAAVAGAAYLVSQQYQGLPSLVSGGTAPGSRRLPGMEREAVSSVPSFTRAMPLSSKDLYEQAPTPGVNGLDVSALRDLLDKKITLDQYNKAHVTVELKNAPPGTRASIHPRSTVPTTVDVDYGIVSGY